GRRVDPIVHESAPKQEFIAPPHPLLRSPLRAQPSVHRPPRPLSPRAHSPVPRMSHPAPPHPAGSADAARSSVNIGEARPLLKRPHVRREPAAYPTLRQALLCAPPRPP